MQACPQNLVSGPINVRYCLGGGVKRRAVNVSSAGDSTSALLNAASAGFSTLRQPRGARQVSAIYLLGRRARRRASRFGKTASTVRSAIVPSLTRAGSARRSRRLGGAGRDGDGRGYKPAPQPRFIASGQEISRIADCSTRIRWRLPWTHARIYVRTQLPERCAGLVPTHLKARASSEAPPLQELTRGRFHPLGASARFPAK